MRLFDGYAAVDWSASSKPKRGKDSIWIAIQGVGGTKKPENPPTRQEAVEWIERLLKRATAEGRRFLVGFDFPFGYPVGTARSLTGRDGWEAVWSRIAEVVKDAGQVDAVAAALQELDKLGELKRHLRAPSRMPSAVCSEEALILGMQDPKGFQRAADMSS